MDKFKARLKQDAERLEAGTTPELQARIEASLHTVRDARAITARQPAPDRLPQDHAWWWSALTGVAVLLLVVYFSNRDVPKEKNIENMLVENPATVDVATLPEDWFGSDGQELHIKPADLTHSLEEELANLQTDLEKARDNVERDLEFAF